VGQYARPREAWPLNYRRIIKPVLFQARGAGAFIFRADRAGTYWGSLVHTAIKFKRGVWVND